MHPHALDLHPEVRLVPLSPRVTVAYGPVGGERWQANASIVVGDRATAVIDAMMTPQQTAPVRATARWAARACSRTSAACSKRSPPRWATCCAPVRA